MDIRAAITPTGLITASIGVAVGTLIGAAIKPTLAAIREARRPNPFAEAMKNPVIVPRVPGSPLDLAEQQYLKDKKD